MDREEITVQLDAAACQGPPVLLFPSLAGSVLECEESPLEGFKHIRIWMALSLLLAGKNDYAMTVQDNATSSHDVQHPFVQHMVLQNEGRDFDGFRVIMGVISNMLRSHGYTEWDGNQGRMIGCSYDWRLNPGQLEARDGFFTKMMTQMEDMVAATGKPAVVVGFSLGCRIAKYLLHFCHAAKGDAWMARNVAHFVPLGGPFLGSVQLLQAVLVDGSFPPLDILFSKSEMLTILRSTPVGRYLQPTQNWNDGLDHKPVPTARSQFRDRYSASSHPFLLYQMPFIYIRDEVYLKVAIGSLTVDHSSPQYLDEGAKLWLDHGAGMVLSRQDLSFHTAHPFTEGLNFAFEPNTEVIQLTLLIESADGTSFARAQADICIDDVRTETRIMAHFNQLDVDPMSDRFSEIVQDEDTNELQLANLRSSYMLEAEVSTVHQCDLELAVQSVRSSEMTVEGYLPAEHSDHPLHQHTGWRTTEYTTFCSGETRKWKPASTLSLHQYEGLEYEDQQTWKVPCPGGWVDDSVAPPCANVTAIYGVNIRTPRALFLKHRKAHHTGGHMKEIEPAFELDVSGEVDGLVVIDGIGFETRQTEQLQQDTGHRIHLSGDGTVNYQSLRHAATWSNTCNVQIFELPGCNHRGVSSDQRMLDLLQDVLQLRTCDKRDATEKKMTEAMENASNKFWGVYERCSDAYVCMMCGKVGWRPFNYRRIESRIVVFCMAVVVMVCSVFDVVIRFSEEYGVLTTQWGSSASLLYHPDDNKYSILADDFLLLHLGVTLQSSLYLGVDTYAYTGRSKVTENTSYLTYGDLQVSEFDTTCSEITQNYSSLMFSSATIHSAHPRADDTFSTLGHLANSTTLPNRAASTTLCFHANCDNHRMSFFEYSPTFGCSRNLTVEALTKSFRDLWSGEFSDGSCTPTSFSLLDKEYAMSMRVSCKGHQQNIPNDQYAGRATVYILQKGVFNAIAINTTYSSSPTSSSLSDSGEGSLSGIAMADVYVRAGGSVSIGGVYESTALTCIDSSSATWFRPLSQQHTSSMPSGTVKTGVTSCVPAVDRADYGVPLGLRFKCVDTFSDCIVRNDAISRNLSGSDSRAGHCKAAALSASKEFCQECSDAGFKTFSAGMCANLILILLVWLNVSRTSAWLDSRCKKFWTTPLVVIACGLLIYGYENWKYNCYQKATHTAQGMIDARSHRRHSGVENALSDYIAMNLVMDSEMSLKAFTPLVVVACLVVVWMINLITPVPEAYAMPGCLDFEERDLIAENSRDEIVGDSTFHATIEMAVSELMAVHEDESDHDAGPNIPVMVADERSCVG